MQILTNPLLDLFFLISFILAKFLKHKKPIAISLIKYLNFKFFVI